MFNKQYEETHRVLIIDGLSAKEWRKPRNVPELPDTLKEYAGTRDIEPSDVFVTMHPTDEQIEKGVQPKSEDDCEKIAGHVNALRKSFTSVLEIPRLVVMLQEVGYDWTPHGLMSRYREQRSLVRTEMAASNARCNAKPTKEEGGE